MNDFTKEELEQIFEWAVTGIDFNPSKLEISLFEKVKSMIDNYCEHESDQIHYSNISVYQCLKCGKLT